MTTTQASGALPFVPSQGHLILGIWLSAAVSVIGSSPFSSSAFVPPSVAYPLHPSLSVEESPALQAQYLMALMQKLQGMALSLHPSVAPATPKVPLQPASMFQAHPTAPPPLPSPQHLTTSVLGVTSLPPAQTLYNAQHFTPAPGGQPLGLTRAHYPLSPLPSTIPVQQSLLPHSAPIIAQHSAFPYPMHQHIPSPACIPLHSAPMHGYTGPHVASPSDVMVDPEEHLGATHMAYANPAQAAPSLPVATPDALLTRMGDLERALRIVQGGERQSFQFRDLCYFPEVVLPPELQNSVL